MSSLNTNVTSVLVGFRLQITYYMLQLMVWVDGPFRLRVRLTVHMLNHGWEFKSFLEALLKASFQWLNIDVFDALLADSSMCYRYAFTGTMSILSSFISWFKETLWWSLSWFALIMSFAVLCYHPNLETRDLLCWIASFLNQKRIRECSYYFKKLQFSKNYKNKRTCLIDLFYY